MTRRFVTEEEVDRMVSLYADGLSSNDVGTRLRRDGRLVRTHLKLRGVLRGKTSAVRLATSRGKIRSEGRRADLSFFEEVTPASAWVLGLIAGDGHVQRHASSQHYSVFLSGSEEVMRKAAALIGYSADPSPHSQSPNIRILRFGGWDIVELLEEKYGLNAGKKATTLRLPELPAAMLPHFLRGLWDADGHWRRSRAGTLTTSLTTASRSLCDDITQALRDHLAFSGHSVAVGTKTARGRTFTWYQLSLNKDSSDEFRWWVYGSSTDETRCSRKHAITCVEGGYQH